MPQVQNRRFGALEYESSAAIDFPFGLPGFEQARRFALIGQPRVAPALILQDLDSLDLSFLVLAVGAIQPDYELAATSEDLEALGLDPARQPVIGEEVLCLAILSAPENGPLTANFLAPVVVNLRTRVALQAVRVDRRYSHQHPLTKTEDQAPCS